MIRLKNVFSDGALFQQCARMEVRGWAEPGAAMELKLTRGGREIFASRGCADGEGRFALPLETPKGGYDRYEISVSDGRDAARFENVLFGELWLAAGQSNMEMPLSQMPGRKEFARSVAGMDVRFFQDNPNYAYPGYRLDMDFFFEEQEDAPGFWCDMEDEEKLMNGSALALAACRELQKRLDVPVGFLNCNMGGTFLENWLPLDALRGELEAPVRAIGRWPEEGKYNTYKGQNFQQMGVMYYLLVPALCGVKVRGIWWYQGESNAGFPEPRANYKAALQVYYDFYRERFAAGDDFPMLCAQLFYWVYGEQAGRMGQINLAMADKAVEQPEHFGVVPNYDLPPRWAANLGNHPIHPAHKLELGRRFAEVTMNRAYGGKGLPSAAALAETIVLEDRIRLRFDAHGFPLTAQGEIRNFSVADERGVYLPAKARIVSDDTVELTQGEIAHPTRAMYQYLEPEIGGNLCCGGLPVAPVLTFEEPLRPLPVRPWLDLARDSAWVIARAEVRGEPEEWIILDAYDHAVWSPEAGCELCRDHGFGTDGAVRLWGETSPVAMYARAWPCMALDLDSFSELRLRLFGHEGVSARLELLVRKNDMDVRTVTIPGQKREEFGEDWAELAFPLALGKCKIEKLRFVFDVDRPVKAVTVENLRAVPR